MLTILTGINSAKHWYISCLSDCITKSQKKTGTFLPLSFIYPTASNISSIKIPYPFVGSFTSIYYGVLHSHRDWQKTIKGKSVFDRPASFYAQIQKGSGKELFIPSRRLALQLWPPTSSGVCFTLQRSDRGRSPSVHGRRWRRG